MSVAAAKRTVLAAASMLAIVALSILVPTGGASSARRDSEPPTTPQNVRVAGATQSLVRIAWDPSTDNVGVKGYYIFGDKGKATVDVLDDQGNPILDDNGKPIGDAPAFTVDWLGCGQSTELTVIAFDAAQNRSGKATVTVSTAACADLQPPTAPSAFTQVATNTDSVVLAWAASSDNVGVVEYGVNRDLQRVATPTQPTVTLTGLSCGSTYQYAVDAADAAGNRSPLAQAFVQTASCPSATDTISPSTPSGLAASNITETGLTLNWNASSDNVGVTGYDVYRNGTKVASVTSTSASQSGLSCGTPYTFAVRARDAAGHTSAAAQFTVSTAACSTTTPPPTDTISPSTPTGLAASNIAQTGLALKWNASSDNVGVTGYDVYRNGARVASVTSTTVSQSTLSCGTSYPFAVRALDGAGRTSAAAQLTASTAACSTTPPPTDTTPPSTPTGLGISSATQTSVSLAWNPSTDNVAVAGYRLYVNGSLNATTTQPGTTVSNLSCGTSYSLAVDALDAAANNSPQASVTGSTAACTDTQAPTTPTNVVASSRTATSIALSWSASSDSVGVAGYGLYRGGVEVGSTPTTTGIFAGLTCNTNYTLAVDAYDASGNRSTKGTVMVATTACPDTTPPSAPTNLTVSNVTQSGATLGWNASSDNVGVTGYDIYRSGAKVSSVTTTTTSDEIGLACGTSYTYGVVARDAAGNSSPATQIVVTTTACATASPGWTYCAQENKDCVFSGTKEVEYGANGTFTSPRTFASGVACTNTVFGDPAPNIAKFCQYRDVTSAPPGGSTGTPLSSFSSFKNNSFGEAPNGHIFEHRWYSSDSGGPCSVWTGLASTCTTAWPDGSGVSEVSTPYGAGFNMRAYSGFKRASGALVGLADINHLVPTSGYLGTTTEISGNIMFPSAGNPKTSAQPTGFPAYGDWNVLWEFTQSTLVGNRIGIDATTAGGPKLYVMTSDPSNPNAPNGRKAWSPTIQFDRWYTFRWQIHWSNNSDGWVNFWWDGQQIASWTGRSINTSAGNPYVEMGWYGGDAQARNEVVWAGLQSG